MQLTTTKTRTIGELVAERPSRARVFEQAGIDYCCGGRLSLEAACRKKGLDPRRVLADLAAAEAPEPQERVWTQATLTELADHIEQSHHAFLRQELPRLSALTQKVSKVHGRTHPELLEVARLFEAFSSDMVSHMNKEEGILFPMIRALEARGPMPAGVPGSVGRPIAMMVHEHDVAGRMLEQLRELTGGFIPPEGACGSYRAMLDGLASIEADTHRHVHKENSILFPGAERLEAAPR